MARHRPHSPWCERRRRRMTLITKTKFSVTSETIFHRFALSIVDLSLFDVVFVTICSIDRLIYPEIIMVWDDESSAWNSLRRCSMFGFGLFNCREIWSDLPMKCWICGMIFARSSSFSFGRIEVTCWQVKTDFTPRSEWSDRHDGLNLSFIGEESFTLLCYIGLPRFWFESSEWQTCDVNSI